MSLGIHAGTKKIIHVNEIGHPYFVSHQMGRSQLSKLFCLCQNPTSSTTRYLFAKVDSVGSTNVASYTEANASQS